MACTHLDPAHRPEGLAVERVADASGSVSTCDVDVVDHGNAAALARATCGQPLRAAARPPASSGWNGTAPTPAAAARAWRRMALSTSQALSTPALLPAITVCAGSLKLTASTTSPVLGRSARPRRSLRPPSAASSPRIAAMAPAPTGTASCMAWARKRTSGSGVGQRQRAGGDQRACTRPANGRPPPPAPRRPRRARRGSGDAGHQHHRLGVGGQLQRLLGAVAGSARPMSSPSASDASASACRAPPGGRPRRRACRRTASPGRERRMQTVSSCRRKRVQSGGRDSEVEQHRAPGEAAADAFQHHGVAAADLALAHGDVQRQRDRGGRGVAVLRRR